MCPLLGVLPVLLLLAAPLPVFDDEDYLPEAFSSPPPVMPSLEQAETGFAPTGASTNQTASVAELPELPEHYTSNDSSREQMPTSANGAIARPPEATMQQTLAKLGVSLEEALRAKELKWNELTGPLDGDDARVVAYLLATSTSLEKLYLDHASVDDVGASSIGESLKSSQHLNTLSLSYCRLGDAGAVALADGITSSARLAELRLAYNAIGDVGAAALSRSLIANNVLTELYLWRNKIGDVGAKALCNALASNRRLALLDLRWNKIKHAVDVFTSNTENRTCWNSSPMFRHLLQRDPANCALTWNIGHSEL